MTHNMDVDQYNVDPCNMTQTNSITTWVGANTNQPNLVERNLGIRHTVNRWLNMMRFWCNRMPQKA